MTYTCEGNVRPDCGVRHRSIAAAVRCCRQDNRAVKRGNGPRSYSDRHVVGLAADGRHRKLTGDEYDEVVDAEIAEATSV